MKQTLQYIFLYFFVPIIARNETRWPQCTNQKIVAAVYAWFDADRAGGEWNERFVLPFVGFVDKGYSKTS